LELRKRMYFLNGDRLYIKPENNNDLLDAQLQNCLEQLKQINSGKIVFKLNFFVDASSDEAYQMLHLKVKQLVSTRFSTPVITGIIAQPPLTCKVVVEAFYYDASRWATRWMTGENGGAMLFKRDQAEILIGNVQVRSKNSCRKNAESAFASFNQLLHHFGFPVSSVVRQWNYLENILGLEGDKQRYQEFNNVRSDFYNDHFSKTGYPAATGIGMNRGGIIIEFVAVRPGGAKTFPLDNPGQVAAHSYSENVLIGEKSSIKTTPKFERARYLELFGKKLIFISGTASIRGEKTLEVGSPAGQTKVTIENIRRLYSPEVLSGLKDNKLHTKYGHARVYVKNREDFAEIKTMFESFFGNLPVVYILADICRDNLLVEIEGKVILE
jgi:hypothetical protein